MPVLHMEFFFGYYIFNQQGKLKLCYYQCQINYIKLNKAKKKKQKEKSKYLNNIKGTVRRRRSISLHLNIKKNRNKYHHRRKKIIICFDSQFSCIRKLIRTKRNCQQSHNDSAKTHSQHQVVRDSQYCLQYSPVTKIGCEQKIIITRSENHST